MEGITYSFIPKTEEKRRLLVVENTTDKGVVVTISAKGANNMVLMLLPHVKRRIGVPDTYPTEVVIE
ncbi:hypothetical protein SAMN02745116_02508 [Pilibacter termitis]|uniref:Uncharacterized protein n=1 Tax=Pilibacter termitis TaxID=263852 RepID=A0A1T4RAQ1_9ENTE|nr:hypothetical protein [Pilibacter termitis]SKA12886.1 hypothetical protein SAMN02745116_02508 [Pilibacter termitis]